MMEQRGFGWQRKLIYVPEFKSAIGKNEERDEDLMGFLCVK